MANCLNVRMRACKRLNVSRKVFKVIVKTFRKRSSAIAEGPRDASCQLKSCQLPRNSAETTCMTSPEEIEVMKLEGYSGPMCNKHVHSNMTRSSPFHCPIGVINKPTTDVLWISPDHLYTDDLLWRNFLSPQCRNCSRDPDHAHLGNTHSSRRLHMADPYTKFEVSSISRCGNFTWGVKFQNPSPDHDHAPFMEDFSLAGWELLW